MEQNIPCSYLFFFQIPWLLLVCSSNTWLISLASFLLSLPSTSTKALFTGTAAGDFTISPGVVGLVMENATKMTGSDPRNPLLPLGIPYVAKMLTWQVRGVFWCMLLLMLQKSQGKPFGDVSYPVNNGIFTISTAAGFLPSTVCKTAPSKVRSKDTEMAVPCKIYSVFGSAIALSNTVFLLIHWIIGLFSTNGTIVLCMAIMMSMSFNHKISWQRRNHKTLC